MKNIFILLVFVSVLTSCSGKMELNNKLAKKAYLYGSLQGGSGELLFLQKMTSSGYLTLDSARIDHANKFSFIIQGTFPEFYAIKNTAGNHIPVILLSE
jgi:hypothetical protein